MEKHGFALWGSGLMNVIGWRFAPSFQHHPSDCLGALIQLLQDEQTLFYQQLDQLMLLLKTQDEALACLNPRMQQALDTARFFVYAAPQILEHFPRHLLQNISFAALHIHKEFMIFVHQSQRYRAFLQGQEGKLMIVEVDAIT